MPLTVASGDGPATGECAPLGLLVRSSLPAASTCTAGTTVTPAGSIDDAFDATTAEAPAATLSVPLRVWLLAVSVPALTLVPPVLSAPPIVVLPVPTWWIAPVPLI